MPVVVLIFYGNASANKLKCYFICKQKVNGRSEAFFFFSNIFFLLDDFTLWLHSICRLFFSDAILK